MDGAAGLKPMKFRDKRKSDAARNGRLSITGLDAEALNGEMETENQEVVDYYRTVVAPTVTESGVLDAPIDVIWEAIRLADFSWCSAVKGAAELQSGASLASIGSTRMVVWADNDQTWQLMQVKCY
jgi:hypothetical protein